MWAADQGQRERDKAESRSQTWGFLALCHALSRAQAASSGSRALQSQLYAHSARSSYNVTYGAKESVGPREPHAEKGISGCRQSGRRTSGLWTAYRSRDDLLKNSFK